MKKILTLPFMFLCFCLTAKADHITGGEMYYTSIRLNNGSYQYHVTLKLLKRCSSNRQFNNPSIISIFDKATYNRVSDVSVPISRTETLQLNNTNQCITDPPAVCYDVAYFEFNITLPASSGGYLISSQVVYRIAGIVNLTDNYNNIGATYTAEIPGNGVLTDGASNESARFVGSDMVVVCAGNSFNYSFAADDDDGDQLRYSFAEAYQGGSGGNGNNGPSAAPPYYSVPYGSVYDGSSPLGGQVKIDAVTGLITGIAPPESGTYVVTVKVEEIRQGVVISEQRKDIQINIAPCSIAGADLQKEYMLCGSSQAINLANMSTSPLISSQTWELINTAGTTIFTTSNSSLNYSFTDTGLYTIKLVINRGQACSDSTTSIARVYPGFFPDFHSSGICFTKPTFFADASTSVYGIVNSWNWNFGESFQAGNVPGKNATFTYTFPGTKNIRLVAGNSVGCLDTVYKDISIIEKPPILLAFRDTLVCVNDALQLKASGTGVFRWTPSLNMSNPNTPTPGVTPAITTTYIVDLDEDGCMNKDSVKVRVTDHVNLQAMSDTTICQGDAIQVKIVSDGFRYSWTPATQMADASIKMPIATTNATTRYEVTASIGGCTATDQVLVSTVPYPAADAGRDTVICYNGMAQLHGATNGTSFNWSPVNAINNRTVLNPVVRPLSTTNFIFSAFDNRGCPKPGKDTVAVTVLPLIQAFAGRDTSIITGQPLQMQASGGLRYSWSPATGLSNTNTSGPVALFSQPSAGIQYKVLVYNEAGCVDSAFLRLKVFKTLPSVFVPTAFSPNNDGQNDLLRPIAVGMERIEYFNVYNRWGQMVFSGAENGRGWDGKIGGRLQDTGVFVWMVKATDYTGSPYFQKGTVMLIR